MALRIREARIERAAVLAAALADEDVGEGHRRRVVEEEDRAAYDRDRQRQVESDHLSVGREASRPLDRGPEVRRVGHDTEALTAGPQAGEAIEAVGVGVAVAQEGAGRAVERLEIR